MLQSEIARKIALNIASKIARNIARKIVGTKHTPRSDAPEVDVCGSFGFKIEAKTEKTLHGESDEPVELAHYRTLKFEERHGYLTSERKMKTKRAGEKQQDMMEHLNSYHLR